MTRVWAAAVRAHFGPAAAVVDSRPLSGGYVADDVRLLEVDRPDGPVRVVWKRTTAREVAALRAVAAVPGMPDPLWLADGTDPSGAAPSGTEPWVLMRQHPGAPLVPGDPVPDQVYEVLARVHAHHLDRPPPGLPVVDAGFWRRLCLEAALPAVRGARTRADHPHHARAEALLTAWADDPRMHAALAALPATLAHGDLHRGNILATPGGDAAVIDWGNARIAPGALDLAVLAEQGGVDEDRYHQRLAELTGRPVGAAARAAGREWARAAGYVQYLGFAADHLGPDRVGEMTERAAEALDRLGPALTRLRSVHGR